MPAMGQALRGTDGAWALGGEGQLRGVDSEYSSTPAYQEEERRGGGDK